MKYPIDFLPSFDRTFGFWIRMFVRMKLTTLSNRQVNDIHSFQQILAKLKKELSFDELMNTIKAARNLGLIGINTYKTPLSKLYKYAQDMGFESMREIDEEFLRDFLAVCTSTLSDASKKNYRMAILGLFKYIDQQNQDEDEKSHVYAFELKNFQGINQAVKNKLPVYMSDDEVLRFLDAIEETKFKEYAKAKNRLLIKIILYTGMRVGEVLSIKLKDIVNEDDLYIIKITGKGNKQRIAMLKQSYIQKDMSEWLEIRKQYDTALLFCSRSGKPITQPYVSYIMDKILSNARIRKNKNGAHMLRHTFGTRLYAMNKDLILVQEALGHSDINTSRIYTHFDKDRLRATIDVIKKE